MKWPIRQTWAKLAVALAGLGLILWLLWRADWFRELAVTGAGHLGTSAIPFLRHANTDPDHKVRDAARQALRDLGPDAVPPLIDSLDDASPEVRAESARALFYLAEWASPAVPRLIEMVKDDPDDAPRIEAIQTLGVIGDNAREALP